jgi:hypothetical protein
MAPIRCHFSFQEGKGRVGGSGLIVAAFAFIICRLSGPSTKAHGHHEFL